MSKIFKPTHRINADWDESETLVMKVGNAYCDEQTWEEGGHWETDESLEKLGGYRAIKLEFARVDGKGYRVLSLGSRRINAAGNVELYAHLASVTKGRQQRNGWNPEQICDWVPLSAFGDSLE
jgi:hypothetical protein